MCVRMRKKLVMGVVGVVGLGFCGHGDVVLRTGMEF
jgi:hypothetical protein